MYKIATTFVFLHFIVSSLCQSSVTAGTENSDEQGVWADSNFICIVLPILILGVLTLLCIGWVLWIFMKSQWGNNIGTKNKEIPLYGREVVYREKDENHTEKDAGSDRNPIRSTGKHNRTNMKKSSSSEEEMVSGSPESDMESQRKSKEIGGSSEESSS